MAEASSTTKTRRRDDDDTTNPPKKRKLNDEENESRTPPVTVSAVCATMTAPASAVGTASEGENDNPAKEDANTATATATSTTTTTATDTDTDSNAMPSNWSFKASDFSFGDTSWVNNSKERDDTATSADDKHAVPETSAAGLGFTQALQPSAIASHDHADIVTSTSTTKSADTETEKATTNGESKLVDAKTQSTASWAAGWSKCNDDGTFKLTFDWGSWENANTTIDLNPNTKVGWESQAVTYDANSFEADETAQTLVEQMAGEQDAGDTTDEVQVSLHCKVFNLVDGAYVERGKGDVKVNTYSLEATANTKEEEKSKATGIRARILCRRDTVLTTIINAPILKNTLFEKVGNFIRFGVLEVLDNSSVKQQDDADDNDQEQKQNEDDDLNTKVSTYLLKPINKTEVDVFVKKIKDIQDMM